MENKKFIGKKIQTQKQNKIGINRNEIHVYSSKKYVFQMIEFHGISTIREEFLIN